MKTEDLFHLGIKALIQNQEGKILLLKVNLKQLSGQAEAYWDIPGGRIQKGDTVEQTLRREVEEETGIKSIQNPKQLAMVLSNIRIPIGSEDVGLVLAIFTCAIKPDASIELSEEHTHMEWFSPKEAAEFLKIKYPPEFTSLVKNLR